ncbi:MAG: tetratricopeptide repeat protein [Gammaproteobacteria bacterium]
MASSDAPPGVFARLKQHHLYQVAIAYAVAAGFIIQLGSRAFPYFGWARLMPAVIIVLLAGFPVAIALTWMLVKPKNPAKYNAWQRLRWKLGASVTGVVIVLVVISGIYAWQLSARYQARVAAERALGIPKGKTALPAFNPPADSLVVLPFTNLGGDASQQYFSDGITQELTGALGQIPALRVIAWETAATLRNPRFTASEVGKRLNVANVLNGSILRAGDQVRITTELVSTLSGYVLWSAHYDGTLEDVFKLQDQVSTAIATALKVRFADTDLPTGGTANAQAHDLLLQGRALRNKSDAASLSKAREYFTQAIALDPNYADAHAELASTLIALSERSDLPLAVALKKARAEAEKALAIDPRNAYAWTALGIADSTSDPPDIAKARSEFQEALMLDPSNAATHGDYGNVLPLRPGLAQYREAALLDPSNEVAWNNLAVNAQDLGDWALMAEAGATLLKVDPAAVDGAFTLAYANRQLHRYDQMVAAFDLAKPASVRDSEQIEAGRLVYRALTDASLRTAALAALGRLARYQSNPDVAGNLLQLYLALGEDARALKLLETYCPATPVGCNDLGVSPIYQALHGEPRFEALAQKYTTVTLD